MLGPGSAEHFEVVAGPVSSWPIANIWQLRQSVDANVGSRSLAMEHLMVGGAACSNKKLISVFCIEGRFPPRNICRSASSRRAGHACCRSNLKLSERRSLHAKYITVPFGSPHAVQRVWRG